MIIALLILLVYLVGVFATAVYCRYNDVHSDGDTDIRYLIVICWPIVSPIVAIIFGITFVYSHSSAFVDFVVDKLNKKYRM